MHHLSAARLPGSGRPRTARTATNTEIVDNMICCQDDKPGTSKRPREIARETGIPRSWVRRIAKKDLKLKTLWRHELKLLSTADKLK